MALTRHDPLIVEWHILLVHDKPTDPFLTVSGGELVTQLGSSRLPYQNLDERLIVVSVGDHDFINVTSDGRFISHWSVLVWCRRGWPRERVVVGV